MVENAEYWSELCGTRAAHKLGITAGSPADSNVFDEWFFSYYPYLDTEEFIPWAALAGWSTLEIGLGYGSVARRLSRESASYNGVDISNGPVEFFLATNPGSHPKSTAISASALSLPFDSSSFDFVASIGCLHHTGDFKTSLSEVLRVLKPSGQFVLMVYYAYSYKRWITHPIYTLKRMVSEARNPLNSNQGKSLGGWWFDRHIDGAAPPHTEFVSKKQIQALLGEVVDLQLSVRNVDNIQDLFPVSWQRRSVDRIRLTLLKIGLGRRFGLDLYVTGTKR